MKDRINALVAISTPRFTDSESVAQYVDQWKPGRLLSGDALFYQRYHIRSIAHLGTWIDFSHNSPDSLGTYEYHCRYYHSSATYDMIDAAGVPWLCIVHVSRWHYYGNCEQPHVTITVCHRDSGEFLVHTLPHSKQGARDFYSLYEHCIDV